MPVVPANPALPELPVSAAVTAEGDEPEDDPDPVPVFPLLPAAKAGEAVELTCTGARSSVSCWSLGSATGSCDVTDAGNKVDRRLSGESSVLRSMLIVSPSRVRLADGPLTVSVALVTAMETPSCLSSALRVEIGMAIGALWPAAAIPLASTVTCSPEMSMFCTAVAPVTLPVVPSEVAEAVEVTLPMVMKPPRMEMPVSVALACALADVLGACDDDVADMPPMPKIEELPASGLPVPAGACCVGSAPLAPAVAASSPRVAVAVLPLVVLEASMLTPVSSVDPELGAWGYSDVAWTGHTGAGGRGTPGARRASSGPALATTCPG